MAAQLLVDQRDVVGRVEGDDRIAAQPVLDDGTRQLVEDLLDGAAVAARLLGRDAVDGRGLLGDLNAWVCQPGRHLVGGADPAAVGSAVDTQDEGRRHQAVLERAHARRFGVKPIHGSSIQLMFAPVLAGSTSVAEGGHICVPEAVESVYEPRSRNRTRQARSARLHIGRHCPRARSAHARP